MRKKVKSVRRKKRWRNPVIAARIERARLRRKVKAAAEAVAVLARRKARKIALAARGAELSRLYDTGITLQEIGDMYDISRERVRQLMNVHAKADRWANPHRSVNAGPVGPKRIAKKPDRKEQTYKEFRRLLTMHLYPEAAARVMGRKTWNSLVRMLLANDPAEHRQMTARIKHRAEQRRLAMVALSDHAQKKASAGARPDGLIPHGKIA